MYMAPEDARGDFVLAGATALFGFVVVELLSDLPLYPEQGLLADSLRLLWVFALTGLVPLLLVRYRNQGPDGFGLGEERSGVLPGLAVAAPIALVAVVRGLLRGSLTSGVFGRLRPVTLSDPTVDVIGPSGSDVALDLALQLGLVAVLFLGTLLLFTFLTTRSREGFRRTEIKLVEGLRTFGMATVVASALFGLLAAIGPLVSLGDAILNVLALAAMVLLTDRLVTTGMGTSRATLLAPAILALLMHVLAFQRVLIFGLYAGVLAAGVTIVLAALVESRRYAWAAAPVALLAAIYPTCLSPLHFGVAPLSC